MANFNFNKVIIGGRLTADPELKTTPSGVSVTNFAVAVNNNYAKSGEESIADFFNVTAWRQTAEFISKYFRKASSICIVGHLRTNIWTDGHGSKHYDVEIVADEATFVDTKNEAPIAVQEAASQRMEAAPMPNYTGESAPNFDELDESDELPF